MQYGVTVVFFGIHAASEEEARAEMVAMLRSAGFTDCEVTDAREV